MNENLEQDDKTVLKKIRVIIIVLLILLFLSVSALAARIIYLNYFVRDNTTVVVPDNWINEDAESSSAQESSSNDSSFSEDISSESNESSSSSESNSDSTNSTDSNTSTTNPTNTSENVESTQNATKISLYKGKLTENSRFEVYNMFPGDVETKYFRIKVNHKEDVVVYFTAEVTQQTKQLGDILHIKVTHIEQNKVIYDGTFNTMSLDGYGEIFFKVPNNETICVYKIDVSLPTYAGNEYQASMLKANFKWFVKDDSSIAPPTGDDVIFIPWVIVAVFSIIILLLLFSYRKDKGDKHGKRK